MLSISVKQEAARVPVAVMALEGELDAATYLDAIGRARGLHMAGPRSATSRVGCGV